MNVRKQLPEYVTNIITNYMTPYILSQLLVIFDISCGFIEGINDTHIYVVTKTKESENQTSCESSENNKKEPLKTLVYENLSKNNETPCANNIPKNIIDCEIDCEMDYGDEGYYKYVKPHEKHTFGYVNYNNYNNYDNYNNYNNHNNHNKQNLDIHNDNNIGNINDNTTKNQTNNKTNNTTNNTTNNQHNQHNQHNYHNTTLEADRAFINRAIMLNNIKKKIANLHTNMTTENETDNDTDNETDNKTDSSSETINKFDDEIEAIPKKAVNTTKPIIERKGGTIHISINKLST